MHTIEVDDLVWDKLQSLAIPLVDTPSSVLHRVLGVSEDGELPLKDQHTSKKSYGRAYGRTPQSAYREPILKVLYQMGGSGRVGKILDRVGEMMADDLNEVDRCKLESGNDKRWRNSAQWERVVMIDDGLLKGNSPRGIWELTEAGIARA